MHSYLGITSLRILSLSLANRGLVAFLFRHYVIKDMKFEPFVACLFRHYVTRGIGFESSKQGS